MKVTVSVGGRFHAFFLAKQLQARGYLERIFTSHPWFKVKYSGLMRQKVTSLPLKEILERSLSRIPYLSDRMELCYHAANLFDRQVASRISPCDIFVGWSGFSLHTLMKIRKSFPAIIILEHNSTHLEVQRDALLEEERRLGIKASLLCPSFIEKEVVKYNKADYIMVPSTLVAQTFFDKGFSAEKIVRVPYGIDIKAFRPIVKSDSVFRIVSVGISVRKGTHYLLQAVDQLRIKGLEVWLIGKIYDDIKPFLKKYSGCFKYLGCVAQNELYKYYSQGSVSVLFSLDDAFPFASLEAMACGCPVICSDKCGSKDAIRNGIDGFILPSRNIELLKQKILYLYENQQICKEMGLHARENIVNNFTWDNYGEKVINAYLDILQRNAKN